MDTKVRFNVEDGGVESYFQRMRRSAEQLGSDMIAQSRKYSTSSREVLSDIENQIRAIEKRNRVEAELSKAELRQRFESGGISKEGYNLGLQDLRRGTDEDRLQTKLLREMIDTIRHTSKEEIREDRKGVEEQIKRSRTVVMLDPKGDLKNILKETIQRGILSEIGQEEEEESEGFRQTVSRGGRGFNTLTQLGTSKNEMYALAALIGLTPVIGQGLSAAASKLLGSAEQFETGRGRFSQATGRRPGFELEEYGRMSDYGFTYSDMMERGAALRRSNVGISSRHNGLGEIDAALIERGFGIDIGGLAKTARGSYFDPTRTMGEMGAGMMTAGASYEETRAYMPEFFEVLIDINRKQLEATLEVDTSLNTHVVASIASLDNTFKNPEVLGKIVGTLHRGLTTASTPQAEAMQYHVLSRIAPDKSLWELEKIRESPWENTEYFPELMKAYIGISSSEEEAFRNVRAGIGGGTLSRTATEKLVRGFSSGDFKSVEDLMKEEIAGPEYKEFMKLFDPEKAATVSTGILAAATSATDNFFQKNGESLVDSVKKSTDLLQKFLSRKSEDEKLEEIKEVLDEQVAKSGARLALETATSLDIRSIQMNLAILASRWFSNAPKPGNP